MKDYWEQMFQQIGLMWRFEPADSTIFACNYFARHGLKKILIPGVGYGRNARIFLDNEFEVTGIEISETAISLARENGLNFPIHHGSVILMPYDTVEYDGIYCYALLHLLGRTERRKFLTACYSQLRKDGYMVFVVVSKGYTRLYGNGSIMSKDRFRMQNGLPVFFYDSSAVEKEFSDFGLIAYSEVEEPVKHMPEEEPMKFWRVICRKT